MSVASQLKTLSAKLNALPEEDALDALNLMNRIAATFALKHSAQSLTFSDLLKLGEKLLQAGGHEAVVNANKKRD